MTGPGPEPARRRVDDAVASPATPRRVQEAHLAAVHLLCRALEAALAPILTTPDPPTREPRSPPPDHGLPMTLPPTHRPAARRHPAAGAVPVTGAASGLGRAVAGAVAAAGGSPLLLDRVDPRTDAAPALADAPALVDLAEPRAAEDAVRTARR